MKKMIAGFPDQLTEALGLAKKTNIHRHNSPLRSILIAGLGGSGIGGNFVQSFVAQHCRLPIVVSKGYDAPAWVNRHTLAICSSYSGNTEETLSVFHQLLATGAKIVCVTSGGRLLELARQHGCDVVQLPSGWSSPRACLGYSFVAQLGVLRSLGIIPQKILKSVENAQQLLVREQVRIQQKAHDIAQKLGKKMPIIYSSDKMEAVGMRWRQQINENAKLLCWHHVLPEMNHNELVGWKFPQPETVVIWLRNASDFEKTAIRMDIIQKIIHPLAGQHIEIFSKGKNDIERAIYLTHLGDWVSVFLAEQLGVNAVEIEVIDYLKNELAKMA